MGRPRRGTSARSQQLLQRAGLSALSGISGSFPQEQMWLCFLNKALIPPPTWTQCFKWRPLVSKDFHFYFLLLLLLFGGVTVLGERESKRLLSTATLPKGNQGSSTQSTKPFQDP